MSSDYLELGTPAEHGRFDLAVYGHDFTLLGLFTDVTSDPVRLDGTWVICCTLPALGPAEVIVEDAKVAYFAVVNFREGDADE